MRRPLPVGRRGRRSRRTRSQEESEEGGPSMSGGTGPSGSRRVHDKYRHARGTLKRWAERPGVYCRHMVRRRFRRPERPSALGDSIKRAVAATLIERLLVSGIRVGLRIPSAQRDCAEQQDQSQEYFHGTYLPTATV